MKLTPLDIRHQEFRRAMRGYSEEQVDVFLDEVADEFERLFQDNIELRERIQLLEEQVAAYENLKETLNNTLVSAQQQADATRANAHKEGELVLRDAELKARGIVSEAYSEKQRVQQSLIQLRQTEEDFRFKFRSLLEAHINLLAEDGVSDERRRFSGPAADVEQQLASSLPESSLPDDVSASLPAGRSSDESTATVAAPAETAAVISAPAETAAVVPAPPEAEPPDAAAVIPAPPEAAAVSDEEAVAVVDDEPDLSGYLARLPDPGVVPEESAGEASADEESGDEVAGDEAKGSTVRRFLFGKRDKPESEELFERKDRDFEW